MKKQPDKITAYYYRAANKQTDLNLDNQMHRLLSHAQKNESDAYMFFVDNGYSGLIAERPAFQNLLAAIHENRVQKIVVVSLDRLYRSYLSAVQFLDDMEQHGISVCSITDGDLPLCRNLYHGIANAYRNSSEKGGECR
ncbi:MAG: recombinase family protein [Lachnospiraceae bacterium]|nr:recombinase family protein [Lachnospiraceae bacterium]